MPCCLGGRCASDADEPTAEPACDAPAPAHDVHVDGPSWAEHAAHSLQHNGFCVLRGSLIDDELCGSCATAAQSRLDGLLTLARARGKDPDTEKIAFAEISSRQCSARYDLRLPVSSACEEAAHGEWDTLQRCVDGWVRPVLQAAAWSLQSTVHSAGCVVSNPGALLQRFHADGPDAGTASWVGYAPPPNRRVPDVL